VRGLSVCTRTSCCISGLLVAASRLSCKWEWLWTCIGNAPNSDSFMNGLSPMTPSVKYCPLNNSSIGFALRGEGGIGREEGRQGVRIEGSREGEGGRMEGSREGEGGRMEGSREGEGGRMEGGREGEGGRMEGGREEEGGRQGGRGREWGGRHESCGGEFNQMKWWCTATARTVSHRFVPRLKVKASSIHSSNL